MSYTPPTPATTGELYAAARYNTDVVGNFVFFKGGVDNFGHDIHQGFTPMSSTAAIPNTTDVVLASGTCTLSLPAPSTMTGRVFRIKNVGTGVVTINVVGGSINIDGASTFVFSVQYQAQDFISDGTQYWVF